MTRQVRMAAGALLIAACSTAPEATDLGRLHAETEAIAAAFGDPVLPSMRRFGPDMIGLFEQTDPDGPNLTIPSGLAGMTLSYDPSSDAYVASPDGGAPADGVRAKVYRVLPSLIPILPLEEIATMDLRPNGSAGTRVDVVAPGGISLEWIPAQSAEGNHGSGSFQVGGARYEFAFTIPPLASSAHFVEVTGPGGSRLSARWDFPGPAEVVNVSWDYSSAGGTIAADGEYTVRGPDLVVSVGGLPTARYTFESSHRPVLESLLDRPLTGEEESLILAFESLLTGSNTLVYGVFPTVRW